MGKYEPLRQFLREAGRAEVPMTFAEIEAVLGFPLPAKSKKLRPWWSNNPDNNVMTKEWLSAGFRTEKVDLASERVVFKRVGPARPAQSPALRTGRDPLFGSMKDVTWIAPGIDLTEPADPELADLIEDPNWRP